MRILWILEFLWCSVWLQSEQSVWFPTMNTMLSDGLNWSQISDLKQRKWQRFFCDLYREWEETSFFWKEKWNFPPTCYVTAPRFRLKNLKIRFYYPRGGLTWVHPWHWVVKRWRDNVRAENCRTEIFGNMRHYWHYWNLSNNPKIRGNVSEASLTAWRPLCLNLPMTGHWSLMSS